MARFPWNPLVFKMNKKLKVAILGSEGKIGSILKDNLKNFKITSFDYPEVDVRDYQELLKSIKNQDAVINLAFNSSKHLKENARNDVYLPDNSLMTYNVYRAALEGKVKRVIMASSVHADNFYNYEGTKKLRTNRVPTPTTPYGANKVFTESLGRYYAGKGLEVICIRFGGVNRQNKHPKNDFWEGAVWLKHQDLINLINACLKAKNIKNNFALVNAVSNNKNRIHDTSNQFGWKPI